MVQGRELSEALGRLGHWSPNITRLPPEPASLAPIKMIHLRPHSCIPIFMYINNLLGFIFLGDIEGGLGVRGDLGTRKQDVDINKYINNLLGFIFLGDIGGTWG